VIIRSDKISGVYIQLDTIVVKLQNTKNK
jgi:hypothetical protein